MGLGKLLHQRPELCHLRLQRLRVGGPERGSVGGELGRRQAGAVKGRQANTFARHDQFDFCPSRFVVIVPVTLSLDVLIQRRKEGR